MSTAIRLKFVDFWASFNPAGFLRLLEPRFDVQLVEHEPDYVVFSVFGSDFLKYPAAIRIFVTGENVHPDFNFCDYAFGFDWLEFGDRYYRWPDYQRYDDFKDICKRRRSTLTSDSLVSQKKEFCNFVYSNSNVIPYRDELFHALSRYRRVHSAGAHLNNVGYSPGRRHDIGWSGTKVDFQRMYKFSIACENSSTPGYTTEKIVHAFAADTIPIYFGNPLIALEFNPKRFVNCHDFDSLDAVVDRVAEIDRNVELYFQIMSEPFFIDDEVPEYLTDHAITERFAHIFSQPKRAAHRRNIHGYWAQLYERRLRNARDPHAELLMRVSDQILAIVPEGVRYILVDEDQWGSALKVEGRHRLPFTERKGVFWGPPATDEAAIDELQRQRAAGTQFIAFGAPAFWWLEYYSRFARYLRENLPCVLQNERLVVFDLRASIPTVTPGIRDAADFPRDPT